MHPAPAFRLTDPDRLVRLAAERGFALIVGVSETGRPLAAPAPVLLDQDGTLRFHLSRGNPLAMALIKREPGAGALGEAGRVLVVISGSDAYVSPDWYGEPDQVPTWNYLAVEAEGVATPLDDAGAVRLLDDLSARFEAGLAPKPPWTRDKMSPGRFEALLKGIVAFSVRVERLEGIEKLSQNKSVDAQARAAEGMAAAAEARAAKGDADSGAGRIAALMAAQAATRKAGSRA